MVLLLINPIICLIEYIISHTYTQQSCFFFFRKITKIICNIFNVHHEPDNNKIFNLLELFIIVCKSCQSVRTSFSSVVNSLIHI